MGPQMALAYCHEFGSRIPDKRSAEHVLSFVLRNAREAAITDEDHEAIRTAQERAEWWMSHDRS
jgi:hypothetical protein